MASPSGTSSGSSLLQNSGSDENLQILMDQRKRKRMISNRESARRSRMKKQRHLDDLNSQLAQLRKENNEIITRFNVTTQEFLKIESENSILRAQVAELSHRLQSLNEIICFWNSGNDCFGSEDGFNASDESVDGLLLNNPLMSYVYLNQQPIMASVNMLQY